MKKLYPLLLLFIFLGASCKVKEDTSPITPIEADDKTVVFVTRGDGPRKGLTHVLTYENALPNQTIKVVGPEVSCQRDSCLEVSLITKDGEIVPIGGIEEGKTSISFPISKLTRNPDVVVKGDGGPHRVIMDVYAKIDGSNYHRLAQGVIYLTVLSEGYKQLSCNGPDVAFTTKLDKYWEAQFTSKLRSAICRRR